MSRDDILDILKQLLQPVKSAAAVTGASAVSTTYKEINEDRNCIFDEAYHVCGNSLKGLSIREIKNFIESVPFADIEFLLDGTELNFDMGGSGIGASPQLQRSILKDDIVIQVRILTSSACDAIIAGIKLPALSGAGSRNRGITPVISPTVVCRHLGHGDEKLARALALSHLITAYVKEHTRNLSLTCECSIAAGIGASASIAWLLDGSYKQIEGAISNMVGAVSGMACGGAEDDCARRLSTAAGEAVIQAYLSVNGINISKFNGTARNDAEDVIKNLEVLSVGRVRK